jgi:hypothetical protein
MTEENSCNLADFRAASFLCPLLDIKKLVYSDIREDVVYIALKSVTPKGV